jgi:hypothetical protein
MSSRNDLKKAAPKTLGAPARRMATIVSAGTLLLALLALLMNQPETAALRARSSAVVPPEMPLALAASQPKPLKNYASLMHRDIFRPLMAENARFGSSGAAVVPELLPAPVGGLDLVKDASPMSGWKFIGSATVGSKSYALLQNAETGGSGYYKVGESVNGCDIQVIRPDMMILGAPGQPEIRLMKCSGVTPKPATGANSPDANAAPKASADSEANVAKSESAPTSLPAIAPEEELAKASRPKTP